MAEVPGSLKIIFPLLYYGLCTTMFSFLIIENDEWDNFNVSDSYAAPSGANGTASGVHAKHYANAEYTIVQIGFCLVILDFAVTLILSMIKGTILSTDIYKIEGNSTGAIDITSIVFRKLGVFGAYWAVFQFIAGVHLQAWLMGKSVVDDDIYMDFIPFFIPPIIGLLTVVLPSVSPGDYQLVSPSASYM